MLNKDEFNSELMQRKPIGMFRALSICHTRNVKVSLVLLSNTVAEEYDDSHTECK